MISNNYMLSFLGKQYICVEIFLPTGAHLWQQSGLAEHCDKGNVAHHENLSPYGQSARQGKSFA